MNPDTLTNGYESPTVSQAAFPDQKNRMLERNWLQDRFERCNPVLGEENECVSYFFNQGLRSKPVALFYDGQVRMLSTREAMFSDKQVIAQTNENIGLLNRTTPFGGELPGGFGDGGYYSDSAFDTIVNTSYHVLTTDGILGRDTIK